MTRPAPAARPLAPLHDCPGCGRPGVRQSLLACVACWRRLPAGLRRTVRATYDAGDLHGHALAVRDALDWYRANRPTTTEGTAP